MKLTILSVATLLIMSCQTPKKPHPRLEDVVCIDGFLYDDTDMGSGPLLDATDGTVKCDME